MFTHNISPVCKNQTGRIPTCEGPRPATVLMPLSCLAPCLFLYSGNRSSKTFKPKKNIPEGSHQYELLKHAEATLGSGNLRQAVMLPEGEDLNEWIAVNSEWMSTIHLFIETNTQSLIGYRTDATHPNSTV